MKSILAISLISLSMFSSAASACGMPPARGMSLAKAMEQVEAAPVLLEVEIAEAADADADAPVLAEVVEATVVEPALVEPAVLVPVVEIDEPAVLVPAPVILLDS